MQIQCQVHLQNHSEKLSLVGVKHYCHLFNPRYEPLENTVLQEEIISLHLEINTTTRYCRATDKKSSNAIFEIVRRHPLSRNYYIYHAPSFRLIGRIHYGYLSTYVDLIHYNTHTNDINSTRIHINKSGEFSFSPGSRLKWNSRSGYLERSVVMQMGGAIKNATNDSLHCVSERNCLCIKNPKTESIKSVIFDLSCTQTDTASLSLLIATVFVQMLRCLKDSRSLDNIFPQLEYRVTYPDPPLRPLVIAAIDSCSSSSKLDSLSSTSIASDWYTWLLNIINLKTRSTNKIRAPIARICSSHEPLQNSSNDMELQTPSNHSVHKGSQAVFDPEMFRIL
ncbi:hypothetical protein CANCADRAFT_140642 [Tortispora caseinolytica NRRL Y-17796]|uniref:Uncharacterized protein n=1 Tax=Tortispora caseinolytica NRRL Y-17796 TaxID=767744 RepID=A0A1E4TCS1_9ASCO|nr:hypothetical protein CANCADRAFT_140642 [Tortispora caseinolytica NRRL Y-17796]